MASEDRKDLKILGFAGSLREGSYNRALLRAAAELVPDGARLRIFELDRIPPYNQDLEKDGFPEPVQELHAAIDEADALLIATPEYQQSISGVLKNALDWASRPPGEATITGKPTAIMGATPGLWGTARAQVQLRQVLIYNDCPMVTTPQVLVAKAKSRFDDEGRLTHDATRGFVSELLRSLVSLAG